MPQFMPSLTYPITLSPMARGYLEAVEWLLDEETDWSEATWSDEAIAQAQADCDALEASHADDLAEAGDDACNGVDFWLTRNRHGAGFWDRGYAKGIGERLTEASHGFGECAAYLGDDGRIYLS